MKNQTRGESPLSETPCCASLFVRLSGINLVLVILGAAIIPMGAALTALTDPATYPQLHFLGLVMCWLGGGGVMLCAIAANRTADLIRHNDY